MCLLSVSLPGVRPVRAAVEASAVGPCSDALLPEVAESAGTSRLRDGTVGDTAESSAGQRCADLMAAFVPPTPIDGPSHTPLGAHRALLAAAGVGPHGTFVVGHRQYALSSESTWCRHRARTSRTTRARAEYRELVDGQPRLTRNELRVRSAAWVPTVVCVRKIATRAPGFRPFLGSGDGTGPGRTWRPR